MSIYDLIQETYRYMNIQPHSIEIEHPGWGIVYTYGPAWAPGNWFMDLKGLYIL